jgi:predicted nucleotidyltransferase
MLKINRNKVAHRNFVGIYSASLSQSYRNEMLLSNNRIVIFARKGGDFMNLIENNSQKIIALCKKHKVGKLFVFGSILTDRFNDDSDVDMVVDFDKVTLEDYADNYFDLKFSLEDIFGREVDLLEDKAIRNPVLRRNIDNSKVLVYG